MTRSDRETVVELGAGSALPSLLMSTLPNAPSLVVITDYPDDNILGNIKQNVARNSHLVVDGCTVICKGYEWGKDSRELL
jgi:nicotinamide N-methyltransferase